MSFTHSQILSHCPPNGPLPSFHKILSQPLPPRQPHPEQGNLSDGGSDTDVSITRSEDGMTAVSGSTSVNIPTKHHQDLVLLEALRKKELDRKERRREAVRQCRKRKRDAALKLEAQFKFEQERQALLVMELEKSTKSSLTRSSELADDLGSVSHYTDAEVAEAEADMLQAARLQEALEEAVQTSQVRNPARRDHLSSLLVQAVRLKQQQSVLQRSLLLPQQPQLPESRPSHHILDSLPPAYRDEGRSSKSRMEEMVLQRGFDAALARGSSTPPLNPMAALLAAAEREEQMSSGLSNPGVEGTAFAGATTAPYFDEQANQWMQRRENTRVDDEKELRRKERKREAVRRCRLRKRQQQKSLEQETMAMARQNEQLQSSLLQSSLLGNNMASRGEPRYGSHL
jgi:hypothetical protein